MKMGDEIPTTGTVTLEPHWPNVRRYVVAVHRSDPAHAQDIAATLGCEAPNLPGMTCPNQCGAHATKPHALDCPVGKRERIA